MVFAAVVPVIDEATSIAAVVEDLRTAGACCVLVVDGGSRDGTRDVASQAGAIVVDEPRRGYGRACLTGGAIAISGNPHPHEAVAFLDGDGSCAAADVRSLVDALGGADVTLGRRPTDLVERGAMPWHAQLGNRFVAAILSVRSGRRVRDLPPAKAVRAGTLAALRLDEAGFGWTVQFVARALADPSIRLAERPVSFLVRSGGTSKVSGSPRASIAAGLSMTRVAVQATRSRPMIALMAKAPGPGHAKTRLAPDLGAPATADLWAAMLADTGAHIMEAADHAQAIALVMLPRAADVVPVLGIVGRDWTPHVQSRAGLAAALSEVFLEAFDRGTDRAIAVAGDVPSLPVGYVVDALDRLEADEAVLGPSTDGGYHVIGLRWRSAPRWWPRRLRRGRRAQLARRLRIAFEVEMGGATALEATRACLAQAGWTSAMLPPWGDLDTVADLRGLADLLGRDAGAAPRTAAWFARHQHLLAGAVRPPADPVAH